MRPMDTIIQNFLHESLDTLERYESADRVAANLAGMSDGQCHMMAAVLLDRIAANAAPAPIYKALAAVNGPTSNQQMRDMLLAAREARKVERDPTYVPPAYPATAQAATPNTGEPSP